MCATASKWKDSFTQRSANGFHYFWRIKTEERRKNDQVNDNQSEQNTE